MLKNSVQSGEHPATIVAPSEAALSASRPETFRLPKSGGDPFFGFSRSLYYEGEQRGYWRLIRIRDRGKQRGVTLVPYDQVLAFVRKQMVSAK
jgi:hypothetical protein